MIVQTFVSLLLRMTAIIVQSRSLCFLIPFFPSLSACREQIHTTFFSNLRTNEKTKIIIRNSIIFSLFLSHFSFETLLHLFFFSITSYCRSFIFSFLSTESKTKNAPSMAFVLLRECVDVFKWLTRRKNFLSYITCRSPAHPPHNNPAPWMARDHSFVVLFLLFFLYERMRKKLKYINYR